VLTHKPTKTNTTQQYRNETDDLLTIHQPRSGIYVIGVYGFSTSVFTVVVTTDEAVQVLLDGVPFREDLDAHEYEYFQLDVDRVDADLSVILTALNGDPDLFMSDVYHKPNRTHHTWSGRSYRDDAITLGADTLHYGTYYISVYAFNNCTFSILASFRRMATLQDGVPQAGSVVKEQQAFYSITVGSDLEELVVTLTPSSGSGYLYMSTGGEPTRENAMWHSTFFLSGQSINVPRHDSNFCSFCTYYIMVYGNRKCDYTLLASASGGMTTLQDGQPQRAYAQRKTFKYFAFNLQHAEADMAISVTPVNGDPDLYISTGDHAVPNRTDNDWRYIANGGAVIHID
jgi:hypothetical protein